MQPRHARSPDRCIPLRVSPVGGCVVRCDGRGTAELGQDLLGQLLAQLHAPLVERVDIPHHTLHEDLVLVHCDEPTQREGVELVKQDRVGRLVAGEDLVRQQRGQRVALQPARLELGLGLSRRLAHHQRLDGVVVPDGVVRDDRGQKVGRDELGALVHQLVEGVLPVGAGLAPDDRSRLDRHSEAVAPHPLAVGLHVGLLEVCREAVHVLVVGQDGVRLGPEEVAVPDAQSRQ
eukprot:scaffold9325_cov97-Isochrysis_galbana.AAC.1